MSRAMRATGAAVLLTLLVLLPSSGSAAPAAAPGADRLFSSVNVRFWTPVHVADAARMYRGGIRTARLSFDWYGVQGNPAVLNWHKLDRWVGNLASQGVRTIPILFGAPLWAVAPSLPPGTKRLRIAPRDAPASGNATAYPPVKTSSEIDNWQQFVTAAVERYGPGGSYWSGDYLVAHPGATPMPIHNWQVWNEPNIPGSFWPRPNVAKYGKLVRITAAAIRGADPTARIALAGVPGRVDYHGVPFLNRLFALGNGIKRDFDIVAFHPYANRVHGALTQLFRLRRAMNHHGLGDDPIWVSEIGWGSAKRAPNQFNWGMAGQAKMLHSLFTDLSGHRASLGLNLVSWFDWRDPKKNVSAPCPWCDHSGLIDKRNHRKPAWSAYREFVTGHAR
jgi:hypothetical protein